MCAKAIQIAVVAALAIGVVNAVDIVNTASADTGDKSGGTKKKIMRRDSTVTGAVAHVEANADVSHHVAVGDADTASKEVTAEMLAATASKVSIEQLRSLMSVLQKEAQNREVDPLLSTDVDDKSHVHSANIHKPDLLEEEDISQAADIKDLQTAGSSERKLLSRRYDAFNADQAVKEGVTLIRRGVECTSDDTKLAGKFRKYGGAPDLHGCGRAVAEWRRDNGQSGRPQYFIFGKSQSCWREEAQSARCVRGSTEGAWQSDEYDFYVLQGSQDDSLGHYVNQGGRQKWQSGPPFALGDRGSNSCPSGFNPITSQPECKAAALSMGYGDELGGHTLDQTLAMRGGNGWRNKRPHGCFVFEYKGVHFNTEPGGVVYGNDQRLCKKR